MVEFNTVLSFIQAFGIIVGVAYYILNIRSNQKNQKIAMKNQELMLKAQQDTLETRQIQLFMHFYDMTITKEWTAKFDEILKDWSWTSFDNFMDKYGWEKHPDQYNKFRDIARTYENMGLLVKKGQMDPKFIYEYAGPYPIRVWEKFEPIIIEYRNRVESPPKGMQWEWFEDLYYTLKEVREVDLKELEVRLSEREVRRRELGLKPFSVYS